jgi:hypothetical protein
MKYRTIMLMSLALAACSHGPKIPDPRFEMPVAPSELQQDLPHLETIKVPEKSHA